MPSIDFRITNLVGRATTILLFIFLIVFPKAGIKISGIPITFGYAIFALAAICSTVVGLVDGRLLRVPRWNLIALGSILPLQIVSLLCFAFVGVDDFGLAIAYAVSFIVLPVVTLFSLREGFEKADKEVLLCHVRRGVTLVSAYGIFLFFWRIQVGSFIEIPFLTVNADDVGLLDTKNIDRGDGILKLISTYNNGNIFGVCMLMLLPLYDVAQKSLLLKLLVRVALVLTLSRTVWLGLVAYEILAALYVRGVGRNTLIAVFASVAIATAGVVAVLQFLGLDASFLFDSNLGGRADAIYATRFNWLPTSAVTFPSEIIYVNVLNAFGAIGLVLFCLALFVPVIGAWRHSPKGRANRAVTAGMLMFLICGLSDGPMLLIPVMAIYWSLAALGLSGANWPLHPARPRSESAELTPLGVSR